eukprot:Tamp_13255.p2 GENE.Tamp_13255~~Tamp_13255.p2  ORF type:complete len:126 (+),score=17.73 Tamp_13255:946-1323(+)
MARSESSVEAHAPVGGTITVVVQSKIESLRVLGHIGGSDSGGSEFGGCCARTSLESQPLLLPHFYLHLGDGIANCSDHHEHQDKRPDAVVRSHQAQHLRHCAVAVLAEVVGTAPAVQAVEHQQPA